MTTPLSPEPARKQRHLFEDIFIMLCIAALWPVILGWKEPLYEFLLYGALAGLVVILVRRVRRLHQAYRENRQE